MDASGGGSGRERPAAPDGAWLAGHVGSGSVFVLAPTQAADGLLSSTASAVGDRCTLQRFGADGVASAAQQFDCVAVDIRTSAHEGIERAAIHSAMQHVRPGGRLVVVRGGPLPSGCGLGTPDFAIEREVEVAGEVEGEVEVEERPPCCASIFRRGHRTTVHDLLFEARAMIDRVSPAELRRRLTGARPPLVVDTRTPTDRDRFGVIEPSIHLPRTVVEWHLDPAHAYVHPAVESFDQPIVVVCNGGYSSSLAAAALVRLGYTDVADLVGGFHAWLQEGHPVGVADHSHLDW